MFFCLRCISFEVSLFLIHSSNIGIVSMLNLGVCKSVARNWPWPLTSTWKTSSTSATIPKVTWTSWARELSMASWFLGPILFGGIWLDDLMYGTHLKEISPGISTAIGLELVTWVVPKMVGFPPKSSILIGFWIINHPFWGIFRKPPCNKPQSHQGDSSDDFLFQFSGDFQVPAIDLLGCMNKSLQWFTKTELNLGEGWKRFVVGIFTPKNW